MPKPTTETAANCLDRDSLKKVKQHNQSVLRKKMEEKKKAANDMREKLQQWKEEKKKKKLEEQKKKPLLTVLKPAPPPKPLKSPPQMTVVSAKPGPPRPQGGLLTARGQENQRPGARGVSISVKARPPTASVKARPPTARGVSVSVKARLPTASKQPGLRHTTGRVTTHPPPHHHSKKPTASEVATPLSGITTVTVVSAKPGPPRPQGGLLTARGQENQRPGARGVSISVKARPPTASVKARPPTARGVSVSVKARLPTASKQPGLRHTTGRVTTHPPPHHHSKKPTASEVATPLSGITTGFGKRHMIADLTKGVGEGEKMSLADELKTATGVSEEVTTASTEPLDLNETFTADAENLVSALDNLSHRESSASDNRASASKPKGSSRDSLTSGFRKSKHQSSHRAKKSSGVAAASSKAMKRTSGCKSRQRTTSTAARPACVAKPRKSILKKPASPVQSSSSAENLGASPVLPPSQTKRVTAKARPPVCVTGQGGVGEGKPAQASSSGHVAFAMSDAGRTEGQGAAYRKTPRKAVAQENMRSKLNDWLAARDDTPLHLRHSACFHGCRVGSEQQHRAAPRSQMKASLSVDQLSRQEKVLAQSDVQSIRKQLDWMEGVKGVGARGSSRRSSSQPSQPGARTSLKHTSVRSQEVGSGEGSAVVKAGALSPGMSASPWEGGGGAGSPRVDIHLAASTPEQLQSEYGKCLTALETGRMSPEEALQWLDLVWEAREGCVRCDAQWYRCVVWALKKMGDVDAVLATFAQAIVHGAQPAEEIAQLLTATMKELLAGQQTAGRHRRSAARARASSATKRPQSCGPKGRPSEGVRVENMFQSTTVRFSVKEVTPFKKRRRTGDEEGRLVSVVTPVRRSLRLSSSTAQNSANKGRLPPGTPHMVAEYSALEEVPSEEKKRMLYLPNRALGAMLNTTFSPETSTEELDTSAVAIDG